MMLNNASDMLFVFAIRFQWIVAKIGLRPLESQFPTVAMASTLPAPMEGIDESTGNETAAAATAGAEPTYTAPSAGEAASDTPVPAGGDALHTPAPEATMPNTPPQVAREGTNPSQQRRSSSGGNWPPCKRTRRNLIAGIPEEAWRSGCSMTPLPGWTRMAFHYAPLECWQGVSVYVHPTTTSADVKHFIQEHTGIQHNRAFLVGIWSQYKIDAHDELFAASHLNRVPLEPRVLIPTSLSGVLESYQCV